MKLKTLFLSIAFASLSMALRAADVPARYENNFEKSAIDSIPEEFLVLDGDFKVKEENGNKFLELPGAPLETYGVLFGPTFKENSFACARIFSTGKGRRFPTFGVGVNGVGGYKLRVAPAKKALEIAQGDAIKASVPFDWKSGQWTFVKLALLKTGDHQWKVEGKAWPDHGKESKEPKEPQITFEINETPPSGRASITGSPYAGTPIRFDDLVSAPAEKK